ncbi:MAG: hypothetical protein KGJ89_01120 [Patescibacteria group bacterium]|nr:hypothetical protein [Patescibacteria group bacterium]MDE2015113.1 hypothetical protein [Patescibacteria group bacterium]MDE2226541.1 hypothetical protein [Patescibacteria group bacterium]
MTWWIWILVFVALVCFIYLYAGAPILALIYWVSIKIYFEKRFKEESAAFLVDDDETFHKLIFYLCAQRNLLIHRNALRIFRKLTDSDIFRGESCGTTMRMLQRTADNPVLPPNNWLENFVSIGGGDLLCESKYGCFVIVTPNIEGIEKTKTREEHEALRELRSVIRKQKKFIFVIKKILPKFVPVGIYDPSAKPK